VFERIAHVPTPDGAMETFIAGPNAIKPHPLVIVYMDVWGMRDELYDIARGLCAKGYVGVVPDLYHRDGSVRFDFRDEAGRMMSESRLTEDQRTMVLTASRRITNAMAVADTRALLRWLDAQEFKSRGPVGAVGFCMGGRLALCAAAAWPDHIRATAALHGTMLASDQPDSPHLTFNRIQGEVYCGFGGKDRFAPQSVRAKLDEVFQGTGADYHCTVHPDADHGYALPQRDAYDAKATAGDWDAIYTMYDRVLRGA
jgi:carboxymethylenebutenolidase